MTGGAGVIQITLQKLVCWGGGRKYMMIYIDDITVDSTFYK